LPLVAWATATPRLPYQLPLLNEGCVPLGSVWFNGCLMLICTFEFFGNACSHPNAKEVLECIDFHLCWRGLSATQARSLLIQARVRPVRLTSSTSIAPHPAHKGKLSPSPLLSVGALTVVNDCRRLAGYDVSPPDPHLTSVCYAHAVHTIAGRGR